MSYIINERWPHPGNSEEEARRLGQKEKNRVITEVKRLGLTPFESLVLQNEEYRVDQSGTTAIREVLLDTRGISRTTEDKIINVDGEQVMVHRTLEIPLEDYLSFSSIVNIVIQKYTTNRKPPR